MMRYFLFIWNDHPEDPDHEHFNSSLSELGFSHKLPRFEGAAIEGVTTPHNCCCGYSTDCSSPQSALKMVQDFLQESRHRHRNHFQKREHDDRAVILVINPLLVGISNIERLESPRTTGNNHFASAEVLQLADTKPYFVIVFYDYSFLFRPQDHKHFEDIFRKIGLTRRIPPMPCFDGIIIPDHVFFGVISGESEVAVMSLIQSLLRDNPCIINKENREDVPNHISIEELDDRFTIVVANMPTTLGVSYVSRE